VPIFFTQAGRQGKGGGWAIGGPSKIYARRPGPGSGESFASGKVVMGLDVDALMEVGWKQTRKS
jgi:hypothetical protein